MSSPAPSGRRKSGRAVRAPEKFQPEGAPAGAKRKRSGRDVENDSSDIDGENEESELDEQSEVEDIPKPSRKKAKTQTAKKNAVKKSKTNGAANEDEEDDLATPTHAIRLPARPKKARKVTLQNEDVEGLYGERIDCPEIVEY